ncbi:MAG: discoidin domain-containing protein [Oscillospiraceae bacterium]|nr:discoidin domain-containing protein [Oscillospiraceae bacterium]
MKWYQRMISAITAAALISPFAIGQDFDALSAQTVVISPYNTYEINGGKFEGWGTSLCWWANRVGYSDSLAKQTAELFYGDTGLRMNIARYNIGGGDNPSHNHITRTDSAIPGYSKYQNGQITYDWNADKNQRNVLLKCIEAAGDDMIVEMFSNSPPYYMTKSGCSSGGANPNVNNLKDDMYDEFADYLAEVCKHYETEWGVDVQSISTMNEPYTNFWYANSPKQEGCHFDIGNTQTTMILEMQKSLNERGLGDSIFVCGTDETSIDTQINAFNAMSKEAQNVLGRIDTHTYGGSKRTELKELAIKNGKNLWMSEVDGNGTAGQNAGEMAAALWLSNRITTDCNYLNCSAWVLWQAIDKHICAAGYNGKKDSGMPDISTGFWGLAVADHDKDTVVLTKKYYAFGQYSRYIRPGFTMLKSSNSTMAAYDEENDQLVIVATNTSGGNSEMYFDLSQFASIGGSAQAIRTSGSMANGENWKDVGNIATNGNGFTATLAGNSITTFIINDVTALKFSKDNEITPVATDGSAAWNNSANDYTKVFDGSTSTYFDGVGNGWVQADLGALYDITAIGYAPRSGFEYRCVDAEIFGSEDGVTWTNMFTIKGAPFAGINYATKLNNNQNVRYIKYQVPNGTPNNGVNKDSTYCCNLAELKFYGDSAALKDLTKIDLSGATLSGSAAWNNSANDYTKAFDGDTATFFDGVGNGWVQAELDKAYDLTAIGYAPRKGYEARCVDAIFEVSADGKNWTEAYTVPTKPGSGINYIMTEDCTNVKFIRYRVPEGAPKNPYSTDDVYCCNIAEIVLFGEESKVIAGDVDGNAEFAILDIIQMQKFLLGLDTPKNLMGGDMDGNGVINAFDLALMKREILKK